MMPHKIKCIYAWIVIQPDGSDGIPAIKMPDGLIMPLIGSDRADVGRLTRFAEQAHDEDGLEWKLVKFSHPEIMVVLPAVDKNVTH